jgi:hypothetical protein
LSLRALQTSLVDDLFARTADENYITARWCAANDLRIDFFWLAVHALEKYLKAVLLLNGKPATKYGHDIVQLYADVKLLAGDLLPDRLKQPEALDISHWKELGVEQFMEYLLRNGNADNRYLIYGYVWQSQDVHMLDQVVFGVRRLTCALDERYISTREPGAPTSTNRDILAAQPSYFGRLFLRLDELISASEDTPARIAALNLNMAFAPPNYKHIPMRGGTSSRNPVILRNILRPLESSDARSAAEGLEIACWLLANVRVPDGVHKQIKAAIAKARTRHSLHHPGCGPS